MQQSTRPRHMLVLFLRRHWHCTCINGQARKRPLSVGQTARILPSLSLFNVPLRVLPDAHGLEVVPRG